jgi:3-deoxy-7-phosphoheptulonate synthase
MSRNWRSNSWRDFPIRQQPNYPDDLRLEKVEEKLRNSPPLVYFEEAQRLKKQLVAVCRGEAFLLQGGDCAESFAEFSEQNLVNYFKVILQMTVVLMQGSGKPVVKVGRIAGQFAKPRSADTEIVEGKEYISYRGDMVNGIDTDEEDRIPNPYNLVRAYEQSAATLNFLRSLSSGGFASLNNIRGWLHDFAASEPKLSGSLKEIERSAKFFNACGFDLKDSKEYNSAEFYSSHEALLLNYEEALTRVSSVDSKAYCCSAHMLWIGERTRALDEAHVEFFRGISNPIASKVGGTMQPDELVKLINKLNPENEEGRLTLITRMGADKISDLLPPLVERVKKEGLNVIWSCDPMHGNTEKTSNGYKTRKFDNILKEVKGFCEVHKSLGTHAGGIHIEMTGQNVTECLGGMQDITELNLEDRYKTHCDPRLNASQSLELAFLLSDFLK